MFGMQSKNSASSEPEEIEMQEFHVFEPSSDDAAEVSDQASTQPSVSGLLATITLSITPLDQNPAFLAAMADFQATQQQWHDEMMASIFAPLPLQMHQMHQAHQSVLAALVTTNPEPELVFFQQHQGQAQPNAADDSDLDSFSSNSDSDFSDEGFMPPRSWG